MVNAHVENFHRYKNFKIGTMTFSKHAVKRFDQRALKHGFAGDFNSLKQIILDTLDGSRLVKYHSSSGDGVEHNYGFYFKGEQILFLVKKTPDGYHVVTVIDSLRTRPEKRSKKVKIDDEGYQLVDV